MAGPKNRGHGGSETRLSMATENYLLTILRLNEQDVRVTLTRLAEHLKMLPQAEGVGTSLPTVGGMIRRMAREGLVETTSSKDVVLTSKGRPYAESIVRRHRLAERLVVDLLGVSLENAHEEAHRLEHAISPELEKKISDKLGNPSTCPFGHPIPGSGYKPDKNVKTLDNASPGQTVVIDRVPEDDQALLEYFVANNLIPGQVATVEEIDYPRRVVSLRCDGKTVVFSYDIATQIWARPEA